MAFNKVPRFSTKEDPLGEKRGEKALRKFKQVLSDSVTLLRHSTDTETVVLYWVNKNREQFVLEAKSTSFTNTMFQDRVAFSNLYLNDYKDITEPVKLEVGKHILPEELIHYYKQVPVRFVTLLPFINNGETVAITVLESKFNTLTEEEEESIVAYMSALGNLLYTYMELSDLSENQSQWSKYEQTLDQFLENRSVVEMLYFLVNRVQTEIGNGGVSLVCRGMDQWNVVMNAERATGFLPIGTVLDQQTIAEEALQTGKPVFSIHFNGNPKRISQRESMSRGATFAVPLLISDRRQAVLLVFHDNPLVFKESTKHKISNMVRVAALRLAPNFDERDFLRDFAAHQYRAFDSDLIEKIVSSEIARSSLEIDHRAYFGLITVDDLSTLRTRLRLEELKMLQSELILQLRPSNFGLTGILGFHSDYIYSFVIQASDEQAVDQWAHAIQRNLGNPIGLGDGREVGVAVRLGYTSIHSEVRDYSQALSEAKTALSHVMKNTNLLTFQY